MRELDKIKVRDVMRKDVTLVDGSIDVLEAMKTMKAENTTSLIINKRDEGDEYGMVRLSDIARQVVARDRAPERVNAFEVMTKPVVSVRPDMSIRHCARLFENLGISQAPVIDGQEIIGIVSYYLLIIGAVEHDNQ